VLPPLLLLPAALVLLMVLQGVLVLATDLTSAKAATAQWSNCSSCSSMQQA
jgi:hypothetical protein